MINTCQTSFQRKHIGWSKKSLTRSIAYMSTSHLILHYTTVKINTKSMPTISKIIIKINIKITSRSHQDIFQDNHHHSLHNIFNDFKYIYKSHTKIKDELYPWEMCHHKRNLEAWTIPFWRSQDEEAIDKPK